MPPVIPPPLVPLYNIFVIVMTFINWALIPLIFAVAFIMFLIGVVKYFFSSGEKASDERKKGKDFILYSIIGFFLMLSLWALVNILVQSFGFQGATAPPLPRF